MEPKFRHSPYDIRYMIILYILLIFSKIKNEVLEIPCTSFCNCLETKQLYKKTTSQYTPSRMKFIVLMGTFADYIIEVAENCLRRRGKGAVFTQFLFKFGL